MAGNGAAFHQRAQPERPRAADGLPAARGVPGRFLQPARRRRLRVARSTREVRLEVSIVAAPAVSLPPHIVEDEIEISNVTFWRRLRRHKVAVAGLVVLAI